jgi:hypothetical protein
LATALGPADLIRTRTKLQSFRPMPHVVPENPHKLRELAAWYRTFAERAGAPWVCEARLQTADDLERYAALLETEPGGAVVMRLFYRNG